MFNTPLHKTLTNLRLSHNLGQAEFGALLGISQQRWSAFECGTRRPNSDELLLLHEQFGDFEAEPPPRALVRTLLDNARSHRESPFPILREPERPAHAFYCHARERYASWVQRRTRVIQRRTDYAACHAFCGLLAFRTPEEVLLVLSLLEQGALPGLLAPASLGRLPHPVVTPYTNHEVGHHPYLCLSFPDEFYFFGVAMRKSGRHEVPVLKWRGGWSGVRVSSSDEDTETSRVLHLPFLVLTADEVLAGGVPCGEPGSQVA